MSKKTPTFIKHARRENTRDVSAQLAAAKAARRAARAASGPTQMDFEMAVQKAVAKQQAKGAKFVDFANSAFAMNTTGTIALVATIPQNVSVNSREGIKATYKSIQIRGTVQADTTSVAPVGTMILVYDRKPTNALPAITDILVTASSNSFLNNVGASRFQIVRRMDFQFLGNTTTPSTGAESYFVDEFVDLKKRQAVFAGATGAIGDITEGALYLITVGNVAAGTADASANVGCRTRFIDVMG